MNFLLLKNLLRLKMNKDLEYLVIGNKLELIIYNKYLRNNFLNLEIMNKILIYKI